MDDFEGKTHRHRHTHTHKHTQTGEIIHSEKSFLDVSKRQRERQKKTFHFSLSLVLIFSLKILFIQLCSTKLRWEIIFMLFFNSVIFSHQLSISKHFFFIFSQQPFNWMWFAFLFIIFFFSVLFVFFFFVSFFRHFISIEHDFLRSIRFDMWFGTISTPFMNLFSMKMNKEREKSLRKNSTSIQRSSRSNTTTLTQGKKYKKMKIRQSKRFSINQISFYQNETIRSNSILD